MVLAGHIDSDNESYVMHWPGLLAVFQATPAQAASWQAMQQGRADAAAISSGVAPAAVRLCIFAGSAGMPTQHNSLALPLYSRWTGKCFAYGA